jgi:hypothetical protein
MTTITQQQNVAAREVCRALGKYTNPGCTFKHVFLANTNQSKDYLLFFTPYLVGSKVNGGEMDSIVNGYDISQLNDIKELTKRVAIDYYQKKGVPIDSEAILPLLNKN